MHYRPLGNTGLTVSEIGLGCGGLGEGRLAGLEPVLEWAFDQGVTLYDTAEGYGKGQSEEMLGRVFERRRDRVVLATKFGGVQRADGTWYKDFSLAHMREALEASLRRLRTDRLDVYQLHTPPEAVLGDCGLFEALDREVERGRIRCYGLSNDDGAQACRFLDRTRGRTIEITFNLFSQKDRAGFVERDAPARRVGLITKIPLSGGLLSGRFSGDYPPPDDERRQRWGEESFRRRIELAGKVRPILESGGRTMAQGALAWILSFPAVSAVIPGISTLEKVRENVGAAGLRLAAEELAALDARPELKGIHLGW